MEKSSLETSAKSLSNAMGRNRAGEGYATVLGCKVLWRRTEHSIFLTMVNGEDTSFVKRYKRPKSYDQIVTILWAFFVQWIGKQSHIKLQYPKRNYR